VVEAVAVRHPAPGRNHHGLDPRIVAQPLDLRDRQPRVIDADRHRHHETVVPLQPVLNGPIIEGAAEIGGKIRIGQD
jgi:hypothetical protein